MARFLQNMLNRLMSRRTERAPAAYLGAFGKHPGWNDHIDDQGLETNRLVSVKRILYMQGMAANIDSGAWNKLDASQLVSEFKHTLVWKVPDGMIVGRMWSSSDGKGRTQYPMVACAECVMLPASWVLRETLPLLGRIERECRDAKTAGEVIALLDSSRQELRRQVADAGAIGPDADGSARAVAELASWDGMGGASQGFLRVLYQVDRDLGAYRRGNAGRQDTPRAQHLRVPACGRDALDIAGRWGHFFDGQLDPQALVLLIIPDGEPWIDVIVGEPTPAQVFCVRAGPKALPLTTDIPYTLDGEFVSRAEGYIAQCRGAAGRD